MYKPQMHKHLMLRIELDSCPDILLPHRGYDPTIRPGIDYMMDILVEEVMGMRIAIPCRSVFIVDAGNEGYTGSLNLTTSHLSYHSWIHDNIVQFDVYSCKDFDTMVVINYLNLIFQNKIERVHILVVDRANLSEYTDLINFPEQQIVS